MTVNSLIKVMQITFVLLVKMYSVVGLTLKRSPSSLGACQAFVSSTFQRLHLLHSKGPYNNMRDKSVSHFVGVPLSFILFVSN